MIVIHGQVGEGTEVQSIIILELPCPSYYILYKVAAWWWGHNKLRLILTLI